MISRALVQVLFTVMNKKMNKCAQKSTLNVPMIPENDCIFFRMHTVHAYIIFSHNVCTVHVHYSRKERTVASCITSSNPGHVLLPVST